jgi:asparagine synthase (glutamine-hydrolysing)
VVPQDDRASFFNDATRRQIGGHSPFETFKDVYRGFPGPLESSEDFVNASLYFELKTFLHGLLVVEDKLSMAHGLESRVPFLDNDLVEFACHVPARYKLRSPSAGAALDENSLGTPQRELQRSSEGKQVLRQAMSRYIPPATAAATKQGFSAPDAGWFRCESLPYIRRLLGNPRAHVYEFVNPAYVDAVLRQHCAGQVNRRLMIWSLLSLEWWLTHFVAGSPAARTTDAVAA